LKIENYFSDFEFFAFHGSATQQEKGEILRGKIISSQLEKVKTVQP